MMIDASLGRAVGGCCGFPSCSSQPQPLPEPPRPPVPPLRQEPAALSVRLSNALTGIADNAVLPLNGSVRVNGSGLCYDAANHAVTVQKSGVYLFIWHVLVQSAEAAADAVITLQAMSGGNVLGISGVPDVPADGAVMLSGTAAAQVRAGTAWVLVNASGAALNIPAAGDAPAAFAASLDVVEISSGQAADAPWR